MTLKTKQFIITVLSLIFLLSLVFVQWMEVARKEAEVGLRPAHISVPDTSKECVDCHTDETPGIVDHWTGSRHAEKGVGCLECHQAEEGDADAFDHYESLMAVIVTPRDCARCHPAEAEEFLLSRPEVAFEM